MEREAKKDNNLLVKTIVFILVLALTFLVFFGLGNEHKEINELVSFFIVVFAELLIYLSTIISTLLKKNPIDALSASCLYALGALIINYLIKINTLKELIVYNIALFIVYLIVLVIVLFTKKKKK